MLQIDVNETELLGVLRMMEIGDHWRTVHVDGQDRSFLVHVPSSIPAGPAAVVILLHGRGIDANQMVQLTGMNEVSDREGFVAVYPNGQEDQGGGRVWPWSVDADGQVHQPAEVRFLSALLDEIPKYLPVDRDRVFLVGFSNGAILAFVAARELSDRIAGIGTVAGFISAKPLALTHAVSLIHIHGTRDRFVPYDGGKSARKGSNFLFPKLIDAMQAWRDAIGSTNLRYESSFVDADDPTLTIRTEIHGPGRGGAEVELITIEGGGHTWPGREPLVTFMGKWTMAFSASDRIWKFLQRHPRVTPVLESLRNESIRQ